MDLNVPGLLVVKMFEGRVVGSGLISNEVGEQRASGWLVGRPEGHLPESKQSPSQHRSPFFRVKTPYAFFVRRGLDRPASGLSFHRKETWSIGGPCHRDIVAADGELKGEGPVL